MHETFKSTVKKKSSQNLREIYLDKGPLFAATCRRGLKGQYNGKWSISLVYVLKPLITVEPFSRVTSRSTLHHSSFFVQLDLIFV